MSGLKMAVRAHEEALDRPHSEADTAINDTARGVIHAMLADTGEAWLVSLNCSPGGRPKVRQWLPDELLYNFCAAAVMPRRSPGVEKLVAGRDAAACTGAAAGNGEDAVIGAGNTSGDAWACAAENEGAEQ